MNAFLPWVAGWLLLTGGALAQAENAASKQVPRDARTSVTAGIASARIERASPDRASLMIATQLESGADFKLLEATGKEVAVSRDASGTMKADVDPRRGYILTPTRVERRPLTREGLQFPGRYVTFTPAGGTNLGGLFLRPANIPLTWNDETRAYATELLVGYEFHDGAERTLAAPKMVTFFTEGTNARIQADTVTIERSGGPGYKRVVLSTGQFDGDTRFTARVGPGDELMSSVNIFREPGALKLSLPSTQLPAFGIGSGILTISLLGRDGFPLNAPSAVPVQLSSRQLRQPSSVVIPAGESTVSAEVRSAGVGPDEIVAQSGAFTGKLPLNLVFPVAAVVGAVAGGALGGSARYLRNRGRRRALLGRRMIEGAIVGVILVGAVWAGLVSVEVGAGVLGTPFGAFVLAALSGYLGCVVLDRVTDKTFRGLKAEV